MSTYTFQRRNEKERESRFGETQRTGPIEQSIIGQRPVLKEYMSNDPRHMLDRVKSYGGIENFAKVSGLNLPEMQDNQPLLANLLTDSKDTQRYNNFPRSYVRSKRSANVPHNSVDLIQQAVSSYRNRLNLFNINPFARSGSLTTPAKDITNDVEDSDEP